MEEQKAKTGHQKQSSSKMMHGHDPEMSYMTHNRTISPVNSLDSLSCINSREKGR